MKNRQTLLQWDANVLLWQNFNLWISFCESVINRHFHLPNALDQSQGQGQFSCQQGKYYCWYLLCSLWDVSYCFFTYHLQLWSFKNNNVTEKNLCAPYLYSQHELFHLQELYESVQRCLVKQPDGAADQMVSPSEIQTILTTTSDISI